MYGSILIAVTFNPVIFKRRPVDEAIRESFKLVVARDRIKLIPITPLPIPLTTPPETRMYFVMMDRDEPTRIRKWVADAKTRRRINPKRTEILFFSNGGVAVS
jgi:hypothetical protein